MLPTFVIGLREGLEAALIVGIVAAFLKQRGRTDLLRWAFAGVAAAVALCVAAGVTLEVISRDLPQRQQEGLETVIGAVAVAMVTYMVVWMRRNSRNLKGQLEGAAGSALAAGSGLALVAMAFLAVLREGLETVVFLLAAFNETSNSGSAGTGAAARASSSPSVSGTRSTAAGSGSTCPSSSGPPGSCSCSSRVASWSARSIPPTRPAGLTSGQQSTIDLTWLVHPGSVEASLLTGMLGIQPRPVLIELVAWLVYVIPVGLYVAWPPGKGPSRATVVRGALIGGVTAALAAVVLAVLAPGSPAHQSGDERRRCQRAGCRRARPTGATVRTDVSGASTDVTVKRTGSETHAGILSGVFTATTPGTAKPATTLSLDQLAALNGGRLPLGAGSDTKPIAVTYPSTTVLTVWLNDSTGRVIDVQSSTKVSTVAALSVGATVIGTPATSTTRLPTASVSHAVAAAHHDESITDRQGLLRGLAVTFGVLALILLAVAAVFAWGNRRRTEQPAVSEVTPSSKLVKS